VANKTVPKGLAVSDYMAAIENPQRAEDCTWLLETMAAMTGWQPKLWGGTLKSAIIGFGEYHYVYESGREGDFFRLGFASRAQNISIHIMPGYEDFDDELARLGKHKMGKSCLYIKRLSDVDTDVLKEIMQKGLDIMAERYPL
jgi:hypothetical protein